jgi:hypothetical protein
MVEQVVTQAETRLLLEHKVALLVLLVLEAVAAVLRQALRLQQVEQVAQDMLMPQRPQAVQQELSTKVLVVMVQPVLQQPGAVQEEAAVLLLLMVTPVSLVQVGQELFLVAVVELLVQDNLLPIVLQVEQVDVVK